MQLPELSIRRPVFATVLSLAVMLIGMMSYSRLSVREYPKIDEPVVTVETHYTGASAAVVESQITKVLEDSLAGIEGVDVMTSISRQEQSQITLKFKLEKNPDSAAADVRDRVGRVRGKLPKAVDEPVITKVEADANPIIWLAFSSDRASQLDVSDIASRVVKPRLQTLPGAADARVFGERRYAMRIRLDPSRLSSLKVTTQDIEDALNRQNVEIPAGRIESRNREFSVTAITDLQKPEEFANVIIRTQNGYPIRVKDLGTVEVAAADERTAVRFNGRNAVAIGVIKQATANPLELSNAVKQELPSIRQGLPEGMTVQVAYDSSVFIDRSIEAVFHTILEAVVLVTLVIFVFLRNFRAIMIPLVTIPVSLIGSFTLMYIFGFSINTLTLLALVLAIGLVVDDAIVMLENIFRHIEAGMPKFEAAILGAKEIGFAVIAMTITLAAVYAPVAFQTGRTGRLFAEFALTLAGAVIVSGFVALSLSPMMCSKLLTHTTKHNKAYNVIENFFTAMTHGYRRLLSKVIQLRWWVVGIALLAGLLSYGLLKMLKSELAPLEDRGVIIGVFLGPEGATIDYTSKYAKQMEGIYSKTADIERYFVVAGNPTVSQGISFMGLTDWSERNRKAADVVKELGPQLFGLPGVLAFPIMPQSLGQSPLNKPVSFVVLTSGSYQELDSIVGRIMGDVAKNPGILNVDSDLKLNKPELRVSVDREKAADAGIAVETIGRTMETMLGGRQVTRYKQDNEQYDVIVQVFDSARATPDAINSIYVRGKNDQMLPLSSLVTIQEAVAPRELNHFNKIRSATITANLAPGYALGEALAFMQAAADKYSKAGLSTDLSGQSREFRTSSQGLAATFVLALFFIYLVLAAQFESFIDPFIIMITVPLAMTGALAALLITGNTLNVYSQIGLVTLIGLITKHGILIVEFANQIQETGKNKIESVIEAATLRLRPILMTTGAMVLGSVPLAFARGAGAESRQPIGWVIVGGLLLGTLLTLFVIPTVYTLLAKTRTAEEVARLHGGGSVPDIAE